MNSHPIRRGLTAVTATLLAVAGFTAPSALAEESDGPGGNGGLNQVIDPNQEQATGRVALDAGHIDMGPTLSTGEWRVQIHDDTTLPRYWRMPEDVAIVVSDESQLTVPDDDAYAFIGAEPGSEVYVVPQTQHPDVIWTGWNTQEPTVLAEVDLGVTLSITRFEGPGSLAVFLQSGNFGAPQVLYDTDEPLPQQTWIELNTHTHANWAFTEPGTYLVEIEFAAELRDGTPVSARDTLRFSVGDATDVSAAYTAEFSDAAADAAGGDEADETAGATGAADEPTGGAATAEGVPTIVWIVAGAVGIALVAGVAVMVTANQRMKRRVREARAARATTAEETE